MKYADARATKLLILRNLYETLYFKYMDMDGSPKTVKALLAEIREMNAVLDDIEKDAK